MAGQRTNTRRMHKLRDEFYAEGKKQSQSRDEAVRVLSDCWMPGCLMPTRKIDYVASPGTTDDSHNLDHYHPVEDRPDLQEDWDNFRHAHMLCNLKRGRGEPLAGLGAPVAAWW